MPAYRVIEAIVVAALVVASALSLLGAFAPNVSARLKLWVAVRLNRRGRPRVMRALAAKLAAVPTESAAGCGSGCSSCNGCGLSRVASLRPVEARLRALKAVEPAFEKLEDLGESEGQDDVDARGDEECVSLIRRRRHPARNAGDVEQRNRTRKRR